MRLEALNCLPLPWSDSSRSPCPRHRWWCLPIKLPDHQPRILTWACVTVVFRSEGRRTWKPQLRFLEIPKARIRVWWSGIKLLEYSKAKALTLPSIPLGQKMLAKCILTSYKWKTHCENKNSATKLRCLSHNGANRYLKKSLEWEPPNLSAASQHFQRWHMPQFSRHWIRHVIRIRHTQKQTIVCPLVIKAPRLWCLMNTWNLPIASDEQWADVSICSSTQTTRNVCQRRSPRVLNVARTRSPQKASEKFM